MRRDAEFVDLMHPAGADLQLDPLIGGADHTSVDRLIAVRLRRREIVFEPAGNGLMPTMHHAQGGVAIAFVRDDDAESDDVGELLERDALLPHLGPDRIGRLFAACNFGLDAGVAHFGLQGRDDLVDDVPALAAQIVEPLDDRRAGVRLQLAERDILQLGLQLAHADPIGERGVDFQRFSGDAPPLLRLRHEMQRAHIVQPVRELHEQDADVFGHREHELAQIFAMLFGVGLEFELRELGDAVDQPRDFGAEQPLHIGERGVGVFDDVMQQGGRDRRRVEPHARQDAGDFERMREIGIAGRAFLAAMLLHGVDIGAVQKLFVRRRVVGLDALDKFELAHHRPRPGGGRRIKPRLRRHPHIRARGGDAARAAAVRSADSARRRRSRLLPRSTRNR